MNGTSNYYIEPVAKFNEIEYNNVIEEKLNKKEYAILRSIINSDSNIKPGINYVEVTNGRYTVYYKGFDDFKVISRKVDADAGRINTRNDTTGRKTRYSKTFEQSIGNEGTTTSNDEVSDFNTPRTRERSGSNTSSSTNIENARLDERLAGDELLNVQDFIDEIKSVGAEVDDNADVKIPLNNRNQEYDVSQYLVINDTENSNKSSFSLEESSEKHSKNNKTWQQHLDKNFKATGTRTSLEDINLANKPAYEKELGKTNSSYVENSKNITSRKIEFETV